MKKLIFLLSTILLLGCTTDSILPNHIEEKTTELSKGKPVKIPKKRNITLKPTVVNTNSTGRIMLPLEEYNGELPLDNNNGYVDWDGDGFEDDLIITENNCYFPRTFTEVSVLIDGVDKKVIDYTTSLRGKILGFKDVNNDGYSDIIWHYGNSAYCYNDGGTNIEYNVGINAEGQYPLPLKDILASLVVTNVERNPDNIIWDLSDYGYKCYTLHVFMYNKELLDYRQTTTYGEWGWYYNKRIIKGDTYVLRFSNVEDNCENLYVEFSI